MPPQFLVRLLDALHIGTADLAHPQRQTQPTQRMIRRVEIDRHELSRFRTPDRAFLDCRKVLDPVEMLRLDRPFQFDLAIY